MSFTTTTKVTYPDGTVQETTTTSTKSQWAPMHDDNLILLTDSYKLTHYKQYPPVRVLLLLLLLLLLLPPPPPPLLV